MFEEIAPNAYLIPKEGSMRVPGLVIASEELLQGADMKEPLLQVKNVACLPGIVKYSIAMPDIHWGYGFPIGGVAAMDVNEGVISPGGVGYDINCGVRMALLDIKYDDLKKEKLLNRIFELVPSGVGHGIRGPGLSDSDYFEIAKKGVRWAISQGIGFEEDLEHIESEGLIEGGDIRAVSSHAKERGSKQMGSIGSGNHFIEIGKVSKIHIASIAEKWTVFEGQTYILVHSGSRGFGHQVCQDTLNDFVKKGFAEGLPDKQLVAAPLRSEEGEKYFKAMAAAANYAFNNRQCILHAIREAFAEVCKIPPKEIRLLYDVCHNIAKFEEHEVEGKLTTLCIHRKGATRAFGPHRKELASIFRETGQPVLVPGDMGRFSYLLAGLGNELTFSSSCHGAGRAKSRTQSMRSWRGKDLIGFMKKEGVEVMASSGRTIAEEMPDAYKDARLVVEATEKAGLAKIVATLRPHLVIKG